MKRSEVTILMAKIAAYDRRTVGEADIEAWTEALDGMVTMQDALMSVRDHFRESNDWLMPKEIIDRSRILRSGRIRQADLPDFPPDLSQAQEREWLRHYHDALAHRTGGCAPPLESAALSADRAMGIRRVPSVPADPERVRALIEEFSKTYVIESAAAKAERDAERAAGVW